MQDPQASLIQSSIASTVSASPPATPTHRRNSHDATDSSAPAAAANVTSTGDDSGYSVLGENVVHRRSPTSSLLLNGRSKNETDEHKVGVRMLTLDLIDSSACVD